MALLDRVRYRGQLLRVAWTMRPMSGGDDPPAGDPPPDPAPADPPPPDPAAGDPDPDPEPEPGKEKTADDYRRELRKYERTSKASSAKKDKEIERLQKQLKQREDEDKSEQEKAVEKARQEGKDEALTAAEKDRRQDRLEVASTRMAARGIQIGEGDEAETVRFADPEDALVHLERAISREEINGDELFNDQGRVKDDALREALIDLLETKPHLRGTSGEPPPPPRPPQGDPDAGKGGDDKKGLEEMSVEEHLQRIQADRKGDRTTA